jgi:uncharacterized protein with HEPN domain
MRISHRKKVNREFAFIELKQFFEAVLIQMKLYYHHINWKILKDFRNRFSHEYFSRDITDIWQTATTMLPTLKPQFQKLL